MRPTIPPMLIKANTKGNAALTGSNVASCTKGPCLCQCLKYNLHQVPIFLAVIDSMASSSSCEGPFGWFIVAAVYFNLSLISKALCSSTIRSRDGMSRPDHVTLFSPAIGQLCLCRSNAPDSRWPRKASKFDSTGAFSNPLDTGIGPGNSRTLGSDPFSTTRLGRTSALLLWGLNVVSFGNSRMKSVSPGKLSRKPMELRSEPEISGVLEAVVAVSGLGAAGKC